MPIYSNQPVSPTIVPSDYDAFLRVLEEAVPRHGMRLLAYCVLPNHFHLLSREIRNQFWF